MFAGTKSARHAKLAKSKGLYEGWGGPAVMSSMDEMK